MITLISGRTVDPQDIVFIESLYHFELRSTGENITRDLRRADKIALVPGFDIERDNYRASIEKEGKTIGQVEEPPTSAWNIFIDQVTTDPLAAPLETVDKGVKQILSSSGIRTVLILGALGVVAVLAVKK